MPYSVKLSNNISKDCRSGRNDVMACFDPNKDVIYISDKLTPGEAKTALVHEAAHYYLKDVSDDDIKKVWNFDNFPMGKDDPAIKEQMTNRVRERAVNDFDMYMNFRKFNNPSITPKVMVDFYDNILREDAKKMAGLNQKQTQNPAPIQPAAPAAKPTTIPTIKPINPQITKPIN